MPLNLHTSAPLMDELPLSSAVFFHTCANSKDNFLLCFYLWWLQSLLYPSLRPLHGNTSHMNNSLEYTHSLHCWFQNTEQAKCCRLSEIRVASAKEEGVRDGELSASSLEHHCHNTSVLYAQRASLMDYVFLCAQRVSCLRWKRNFNINKWCIYHVFNPHCPSWCAHVCAKNDPVMGSFFWCA